MSVPRAPRAALFPWLGALALLLCAGGAPAEPTTDLPAPPAGAVRLSLPPLPKLIEISLEKPDPEALARLDALVDGLVAHDPAQRQEALRAVRGVDASWLPAVAERFERVADSADKPALKALLEKIRERTRAELREARSAAGGAGPITTPDYLQMLVDQRDRSSPQLRTLTEVVAYSRLFEQIATLPAARRLVSVYVRFGEFLRVDTQLALARLKERAVAALVEATGHPAPRIASWAERQLAELGKARPSDALQLEDPALRADVLRAYGKLRRLELLPLLVSYASSDVGPVRAAAREALAAYGEAALWTLRDGYEKTAGERAPLDWDWERLARELFARFDQQHRGDLLELYEQGRAAERQGDWRAACAAFDQVLARQADFELGATMAETYLRCASGDPDARGALLAASRAERLEPNSPVHERAASLRQTLQAELLLERGLIDRTLLERARQLDPQNERAAALLRRLGPHTRWSVGPWLPYLGALTILALGLIGAGWIVLRPRLQGSDRS